MKKLSVVGLGLLGSLGAFAEGGFSADTFITSATADVTSIVTGIGALLTAAAGLYAAFVAYRKVREALNKA